MYSLLIKNCGQILTIKGKKARHGNEMSKLGVVTGGFVACEGDRIVEVGKMKNLKRSQVDKNTKVIDAEWKVVMPGLVDCHTHFIFAGNRAHEWSEKLAGKSYLEILKEGGGILSTVKATRKASEAELLKLALMHLDDFLAYGVTTVEVKSGYGLDLETEKKMLKVAKMADKKHQIEVVRTFLGAHALPPEFSRAKDYLKFLLEEVLPLVDAEFVDIFCEKGAFSLRESRKFLREALKDGYKVKIHGEQLNRLGASKMAAKLGAVSCDHCDHLKKSDISHLRDTVAVLLPLVPLYTREKVYANGRALIDGGAAVAVSTDFNPGSCPAKNIYLAMTIACLNMGLRPEEVLVAVTLNAAAALDRAAEIGSIEKGKRADILILDVADYSEIPYWMGENPVSEVVINGSSFSS